MSRAMLRKPAVLGVLMIIAAGLAIAATPTKRMADEGPKVDLEKLIPETFGVWQIDRSIVPIAVAPDVQAKLDKIYHQTLARTYVNGQGQRVMLSIAYGGDQSDAMRAHRPEVCYAAQGFQVIQSLVSRLTSDYGVLPIRRLVAVSGSRHEPITYWMVVGDRVVLDGLGQKLAQLRYGLTGTIPDGMLVRVSTIDRNANRAFVAHEEFVNGLLGVLRNDDRKRLAGNASS